MLEINSGAFFLILWRRIFHFFVYTHRLMQLQLFETHPVYNFETESGILETVHLYRNCGVQYKKYKTFVYRVL